MNTRPRTRTREITDTNFYVYWHRVKKECLIFHSFHEPPPNQELKREVFATAQSALDFINDNRITIMNTEELQKYPKEGFALRIEK